MTDTAGLTAQQLQVAALAAGGMPTRGIARCLCVSESTVKYHLKRVYERLGVHNRAQPANALRNRESYPNG